MSTKLADFIFSRDMKPLSINKAYATTRGVRRKSGDYNRFATDLKEVLHACYEIEKRELRDAVKDTRFFFRTVMTITTPEDFFFTKGGDISARKGDISNYRKCLQDVIFDFIGLDDKYSICEENLHTDGKEWKTEYTIEAWSRE